MSFLIALQFLTRLPSPIRHQIRARELGRSLAWFPLVGALIGAVVAILDTGLSAFVAPALTNALLIMAMLLITGAFHLDGLMDTCDGIFAFTSPERRLEIMKDSHTGAFGVAAAATLLLVKYGAMVSLAGPLRGATFVFMGSASRWAIVVATFSFPYARPSGLGKTLKANSGLVEMVAATAIAVGTAALTLQTAGIVCLGLGLAGTWAMAWHIMSKIPGLTGDTYGAISEVTEVLMLVAVPVVARGLGTVGFAT